MFALLALGVMYALTMLTPSATVSGAILLAGVALLVVAWAAATAYDAINRVCYAVARFPRIRGDRRSSQHMQRSGSPVPPHTRG